MIPYKIEISGKELYIIYFGKLYENKYETIEIYYSFEDSWSNTKIEKMIKTEYGFVAHILLGESDSLNFCFTCEDGTWDSNHGSNYSISISDVIKNNAQTTNEQPNNIKTNNMQTNNTQPIKQQPVQEEAIIKDRGTLLISEIKDKIFLPYKAEEIENLVKDRKNPYKTARRSYRQCVYKAI